MTNAGSNRYEIKQPHAHSFFGAFFKLSDAFFAHPEIHTQLFERDRGFAQPTQFGDLALASRKLGDRLSYS